METMKNLKVKKILKMKLKMLMIMTLKMKTEMIMKLWTNHSLDLESQQDPHVVMKKLVDNRFQYMILPHKNRLKLILLMLTMKSVHKCDEVNN